MKIVCYESKWGNLFKESWFINGVRVSKLDGESAAADLSCYDQVKPQGERVNSGDYRTIWESI